MPMVIQYRTMRLADIAAGLRFCRTSGWNQVQRDWELFLHLSPAGCYVAMQAEQIVGTVTTVRYQERFGWIGMMLVDPALRGQGIGRQLMTAALTALGAEACARLDATPAGFPLYRKLDFHEEYRLQRMEGTPPAQALPHEAQPMQHADLAEICAWDQAVFGADRSVLLAWLFAGAPELCWVVRQAGRLRGYVFGRRGHRFVHLGPVVATAERAAPQLVTACFASASAQPLILDVPQQHERWLQWLGQQGFREQRPLLRMFRGRHSFPGQVANQFAILGPEFG